MAALGTRAGSRQSLRPAQELGSGISVGAYSEGSIVVLTTPIHSSAVHRAAAQQQMTIIFS